MSVYTESEFQRLFMGCLCFPGGEPVTALHHRLKNPKKSLDLPGNHSLWDKNQRCIKRVGWKRRHLHVCLLLVLWILRRWYSNTSTKICGLFGWLPLRMSDCDYIDVWQSRKQNTACALGLSAAVMAAGLCVHRQWDPHPSLWRSKLFRGWCL